MSAPQHVYDAIKKARLEGEAWVTWGGERLKLVPIDESFTGGVFDAIVKDRGAHGGIRLMNVNAYKDVGNRVRNGFNEGDFRNFHFSWKNVLVAVVERHPREKSDD